MSFPSLNPRSNANSNPLTTANLSGTSNAQEGHSVISYIGSSLYGLFSMIFQGCACCRKKTLNVFHQSDQTSQTSQKTESAAQKTITPAVTYSSSLSSFSSSSSSSSYSIDDESAESNFISFQTDALEAFDALDEDDLDNITAIEGEVIEDNENCILINKDRKQFLVCSSTSSSSSSIFPLSSSENSSNIQKTNITEAEKMKKKPSFSSSSTSSSSSSSFSSSSIVLSNTRSALQSSSSLVRQPLPFHYRPFGGILEGFYSIVINSAKHPRILELAEKLASYLRHLRPSDPQKTEEMLKLIEEQGLKIDISYNSRTGALSQDSPSFIACKKAFEDCIKSFFPRKRDKKALNAITASLKRTDPQTKQKKTKLDKATSEAIDKSIQKIGERQKELLIAMEKRKENLENFKKTEQTEDPKTAEQELNKINAAVGKLSTEYITSQKVFSRRVVMQCKCCLKTQLEIKEANPNSTMQKCSRCRSVIYCSKECQAKDWNNHKKVCHEKNESKKNKS